MTSSNTALARGPAFPPVLKNLVWSSIPFFTASAYWGVTMVLIPKINLTQSWAYFLVPVLQPSDSTYMSQAPNPMATANTTLLIQLANGRPNHGFKFKK